MFFTLYYMYATFIQWWRLSSLKDKLCGTLNANNALLICDENVIFQTKKTRSFENLLFKNENRIGCTIVPRQKVTLSSQWVGFPRDHRHFPVHFQFYTTTVNKSSTIYVLLESILEVYKQHEAEILQIENFGELIAWKISDYFEIILKTDMEKLTRLIHCYSQTDCDINHEMRLLKIETIDVEGLPRRIKYDRKFSKESTQKYSLAPIHWSRFVSDMKNLYAKIRDSTNPKITIDNGTPKPEDLKLLSCDGKPIKKNRKHSENKDTLDVNSSDYRRHKSSDHSSKKEKEKSPDKHKEKEKSSIKKELKDGKSKENRNRKMKDQDKNQHKSQIEKTAPLKPTKKKAETNTAVASIEASDPVKNGYETGKSPGKTENEKLKQENRTSSKDKKLTRSEATCSDELIEEEKKETTIPVNTAEINKSNNKISPLSEFTKNYRHLTTYNGKNMKPPNVLVYADSTVAKQNVKEALCSILNNDKYVIYDLPLSNKMTWSNSTALVVICGSVNTEITANLMTFLINGGRLLCLCSDFLYCVLHTFATAEVREHELVRFSYGKWKNVKMMHHIFCYQASPAKKQFSKDSDTSNPSGNESSPIAPRTPSTVDIQHSNKNYTIQVQILGTEETWQTPSLLLATVKGCEGRAVFSQVHLEINPEEFLDDENKFEALKDSNQARIEILKDILCNHLNMDCNNTNVAVLPTAAYFLGRYDLKLAMLNETPCIRNNRLESKTFSIHFCGQDDKYEEASNTFLPILIHSCPSNFNTVSYFENLNTKEIGRLVIYSDIVRSTHLILGHNQLANGLAVICRQQIGGIGRSNNTWLSPPGGAMFSFQLHIPLKSNLGRTLPILQHIQTAAIVKAVQHLTKNNEHIDIGIKWPNDLYANGCLKIGGILVTTLIVGDQAIANVGSGVNLNNSNPTTCINDLIREANSKHPDLNLNEISYEQFFAHVFNELENFISQYQMGDEKYFFDFYYKNWLHNDTSIVVTTKEGKSQQVKIVGIDNVGYLNVQTADGKIVTVEQDGNSFDMINGLIFPKEF